MPMRKWKVIAGLIAVAFVAFEGSYALYSRRAMIRARRLEQEVENVDLCSKSLSEIQTQFSNAGFSLEDEGCSNCRGLGGGIVNFPSSKALNVELFHYQISFDRLLAELSFIRPAGVSVNFYFHGDKVDEAMFSLGGDEGRVEITRWVRIPQSNSIASRWRIDKQTNSVYDISVLAWETKQHSYKTLTGEVNFNCLYSFHGCRNALDFWPKAPQPTNAKDYPEY